MSKPKTPLRERSLELKPAAIIAIVDTDVWRVRRLSELLQDCGARVLLLGSSGNAMQLLPGARCDVVVVGDGLERPSGPELCDALRDKLGASRPFFVRLRGERDGHASGKAFDETLIEPLVDDALLATLEGVIRARRAATESA
jgi:CheY-like chemotaxis protein